MTASPDDRLAVLIDADNAPPSRSDALMEEVATFGTATVKRIYGDWTGPQLAGWKVACNRHAIQPIQQFAYTTGKNATDSALIIDAMDLLYSERLDGFVLVSSDSDFTRLASRLRESAMTVYGVGERKTPEAFVAACDQFVYVDLLGVQADEEDEEVTKIGVPEKTVATPKRRTTKELRGDAQLVQTLRSAAQAGSDDDGWVSLSSLGSQLRKRKPGFDPRTWGYAKLGDLVTATQLFEMRRPATGHVAVKLLTKKT